MGPFLDNTKQEKKLATKDDDNKVLASGLV